MTTRRLAAAFVSVALIGALSACSNSTNTNDASTSTTSATSATPGAAATLTKDNFAAELRDAQAAAGSAHVTATIESQGQTLELAGDVDNLDTPASPAFALTASSAGQKFQLVVVGKTLYVAGGGLSGAGGKKWAKIDISDSSNPIGQVFEAANPGNFSAYLEGVTSFEDKGEERVDGVDTHHYAVTVDTATMLKSNPAFKGKNASSLGLPDSITSQVYVDGDNRPIEIRVELGASGAFEAHFSAYGKDVTVKPPPADQVGKFALGN